MRIFQNYSKWLLSFTLAVFVGSGIFTGCANDDSTNPTANQQLDQPSISAQAQDNLGQAIAIQNRHTPELLNLDGVIGTGTGVDEHGSPTIVVYTEKPGVAHIPATLENVATRVENIGTVHALKGGGFKGTYRNPTWSGVSVGNDLECAAGTIGCVVTKNGVNYLLSNNHVFARENAASIGERIDQPGRYDNRCRQTGQVASLSQFVPISFSNNNTVDCAIAEVASGIQAKSQMAIGSYTPSATTQAPSVGVAVKKTGRTTGLTTGSISAVNVTIRVQYSGGVATFVNQFAVSGHGFSNSGDSGSLIVQSSSNEPIGLLFAGGGGSTFANQIGDVLTALGVTIVPN